MNLSFKENWYTHWSPAPAVLIWVPISLRQMELNLACWVAFQVRPALTVRILTRPFSNAPSGKTVKVVKKGLYLLLFAYFALACDKKFDPPTPIEPEPITNITDTGFGCRTLPLPPEPFGFTDSTRDENENINCFMYNPANPEDLIIKVNGDIFGYNKIYKVNLPTRKFTFLGNGSDFLPQVNKKNWLVYSDIENQIWRTKTNGDSALLLTFMKNCMEPKWDRTGNYILYYQEAYTTIPPRILKADLNGQLIDYWEVDLNQYATYNRSDKFLIQRAKDAQVTIIEKDLIANTEKALITATYSPKGNRYFNHLVVDHLDENFYWSNTAGVFRCNLHSLKIDTVFKACPNYALLAPNLSLYFPDELTVVCRLKTPLSSSIIYSDYRAYQVNLLSRTTTWIKVFK